MVTKNVLRHTGQNSLNKASLKKEEAVAYKRLLREQARVAGQDLVEVLVMAIVHEDVVKATVGLINAILCVITSVLHVWVLLEELGVDNVVGEGASDGVLVTDRGPLGLSIGRVAKNLTEVVNEAREMEPIVLLIRVEAAACLASLVGVDILKRTISLVKECVEAKGCTWVESVSGSDSSTISSRKSKASQRVMTFLSSGAYLARIFFT